MPAVLPSLWILAAATALGAAAQPPAPASASLRFTGSAPGGGLTIKDLRRVEQLRGDAGGLATSLAHAPATIGTPNDFSGVYKIPDDVDSPYAGWFARFSGALIAVFPAGDYTPTDAGMVPKVPANTRYFLGSIPLNAQKKEAGATTTAAAALVSRVDNRYTGEEPQRPLTPDRAPPVTLDTATTPAAVTAAVAKSWNDPVYRANRLRELLERAR
ncbi:MAG: hypothetical protein QM783_01810 [Phycisphaerales bacterium]